MMHQLHLQTAQQRQTILTAALEVTQVTPELYTDSDATTYLTFPGDTCHTVTKTLPSLISFANGRHRMKVRLTEKGLKAEELILNA